jgi:hypothetical protein
MAVTTALRALAPQPLKTWWYRRFKKGRSPFAPEILKAEAIFIHIPKTAGSSVKTALYGAPKFGHIPISAFYKHDPARAAAFFKFCFVRNPWDRFASAHAYLTQKQGTSSADDHFTDRHLSRFGDFADFVRALEDETAAAPIMRYVHFRPQSWFVRLDGVEGHAMDFVGRYERLGEDMATVRARLSLPEGPMTRVRPSKRGDYRTLYDERTQAIVGRLYAEDVALFDYEF